MLIWIKEFDFLFFFKYTQPLHYYPHMNLNKLPNTFKRLHAAHWRRDLSFSHILALRRPVERKISAILTAAAALGSRSTEHPIFPSEHIAPD